MSYGNGLREARAGMVAAVLFLVAAAGCGTRQVGQKAVAAQPEAHAGTTATQGGAPRGAGAEARDAGREATRHRDRDRTRDEPHESRASDPEGLHRVRAP